MSPQTTTPAQSTSGATPTGLGVALRERREQRGESHEDVTRATRISPERLEAMELEAFDRLDGHVYAKGFLKTYAKHLGFRPGPILDHYREHFESDIAPVVVPSAMGNVAVGGGVDLARLSWIAWALVGAAVVVAAVMVANAFGGRTPAVATDEGPSSPPQSVAEVTDEDAEVPPVGAEEAEAPPAPDGVELVLLFEADCWTEITVDGGVVEPGRVVAAGESLTVEGTDAVGLRLGNAGAVRATLNGEATPGLGGPGAVVEVTFTPDGLVAVPDTA